MIGMNTLELPERQKEANIARKSGEYTIAGPYELKQGGTGALLFDPIYINDGNEILRIFYSCFKLGCFFRRIRSR